MTCCLLYVCFSSPVPVTKHDQFKNRTLVNSVTKKAVNGNTFKIANNDGFTSSAFHSSSIISRNAIAHQKLEKEKKNDKKPVGRSNKKRGPKYRSVDQLCENELVKKSKTTEIPILAQNKGMINTLFTSKTWGNKKWIFSPAQLFVVFLLSLLAKRG